MSLLIRPETPVDHPAVDALVAAAFEQAFGSTSEVALIRNLQQLPEYDPALSLVALLDDEPIGHILLFPVALSGATVLSLGPMAVAPGHQRQGIGSKLIEAALSTARARDYAAVVVLGHPEYYPKFGFSPASQWNVRHPFEGIPQELLFALDLQDDTLSSLAGVICYPAPFIQTTSTS